MFFKIPLTSIEEVMQQMGVHVGGVEIMTQKSQLLPLKFLAVRTPAANIIKQEMLALGGDCATPVGAINCAADYVDILLLGNAKTYQLLLTKLEAMKDWFKLNQVISELQNFLTAIKPTTKLADGRVLSYDKVGVMGILNITKDSFYSGSRVSSDKGLLEKAGQMLSAGALMLDIGAESTRPGAEPVAEEEEIRRISEAVQLLRKEYPKALLSIDTYRSATAKAALSLGADIINDISAATADDKMLEVVAEFKAPLILMHMRGTSATMQQQTSYENVVEEVAGYLFTRAEVAQGAGLNKNQLILDPGIGFAKNVEDNLKLMKNLEALTCHGYPLLLAASRKSTIGAVLGNVPADERLEGTLATTAKAFYAGANLVRVHDVREHVRFLTMLEAMEK